MENYKRNAKINKRNVIESQLMEHSLKINVSFCGN